MDRKEKIALAFRAYHGRREQFDLVSSAVLKLDLMGLTPENGMVECPCPDGIHPSRWTAMIKNMWKEVKEN